MSVAEHLAVGTYRASRHGPRPEWWEAQHQKLCPVCHQLVPPAKMGVRRYCSRACYLKANRIQAQIRYYTKTCACGKRIHCLSTRCRQCDAKQRIDERTARWTRTCLGCGKQFVKKHNGGHGDDKSANKGLYHSRECFFRMKHRRSLKRLAEKRQAQRIASRARICVICQRPAKHGAKFCGLRCRNIAANQRQQARRAAAWVTPVTHCRYCGTAIQVKGPYIKWHKRWVSVCEPCREFVGKSSGKSNGLYRGLAKLPPNVRDALIALRKFRQRVDRINKGQDNEETQ